MGGVNITDQHISYYSLTQRRTIKWWKKVFRRMVDILILNSWIIFRSNFPDKITLHRLFCIQLVHELVQPLLSLKASPDCPATLSYKGRRPTNTGETTSGKTFPLQIVYRGRCVVCCITRSHPKAKRIPKQWISVRSVKFICVMAVVLKHFTLCPSTELIMCTICVP